MLLMCVVDSGIILNQSFTVESRAPPTGHHACSPSGYVQQALPRKECPVGKQRRGPLQKQQGVVCGLTPTFSQLWGCLHLLALKIGLLTLKNTHRMNKSARKHTNRPRYYMEPSDYLHCDPVSSLFLHTF